MPLISEAQKKVLIRLCGMTGTNWFPTEGICDRTIRIALVTNGLISTYFGALSPLLTDGGKDDAWYMQATNAGRAYVELLKRLEELRAKADALQVQEQEDEARRRWVEERY